MKISDETHDKLQRVGTIGETFDDAIKRLLDEHSEFRDVILQVKIVGNKRKIDLKNPMYFWTPENYDVFLQKMFDEIDWHEEWRENILKRIAKNDRWYEEVQKYRNEMRGEIGR